MTQRQSQVKLLNIQEFASTARTTPRTLRFYEQKGLFKPTKIDPENNYRYYDPSLAREFLKIKLLQSFHLPLSGIKQVMSQGLLETTLKQELVTIEDQIEEKQKEYKFLRNLFELTNEEDYFSSRLIDEEMGPYKLLCHLIPNGEYVKITQYINDLWKVAEENNLVCGYNEITFYLDHTYRPKNSPLEIALIVKGNIPNNLKLPKNHYFKDYPKTKVKVYNYEGPYDYLPIIYKKLYDHMDKCQIKTKDSVFEMYMKGPVISKTRYDYLTKIGFPIK